MLPCKSAAYDATVLEQWISESKYPHVRLKKNLQSDGPHIILHPAIRLEHLKIAPQSRKLQTSPIQNVTYFHSIAVSHRNLHGVGSHTLKFENDLSMKVLTTAQMILLIWSY
jgi:hypothetical protein